MLSKFMYKGNLVLPPKSDVVFKAIFGTEQNKHLLAAFLRDVLELEIPDGNSLEQFNTELPPLNGESKLSRLDIRARLQDGQQINVEIQLENLSNTIPRSLTYNSRMFISQLTRGMNYADMKRTISLFILDFILLKTEKKWYNQFVFANRETGQELSSLMEIIFLEMPKMRKLHLQNDELSKREQWALFLNTTDGEVLEMLTEKNNNIGETVEKLVHISADEKLRFQYEMQEKAELDYYAGLKGAKDAGRAEGMAHGIRKGMQQKALETAAAMKKNGLDDDLIAEVTGLSLEAVKALKPCEK